MFTPTHLQLWTLPKYYFGAHWDDYYCFVSRTRDSCALERANYDAAWNAVKGLDNGEPCGDDKSAGVQKVEENHFAVGWVAWIAIHKSQEAALRVANEIKKEMEDYPVIDEELWMRYESEEAEQTWSKYLNAKERIEHLREHAYSTESFSDLLGAVRGDYSKAAEILNCPTDGLVQ